MSGTAAVLTLTYCAYKLDLDLSTLSSLYLLLVVVVSTLSGFWEATILSLIAVTCLNYFFIPPVFTFLVGNPQNWFALGAFEATALIVSRLSTGIKTHAREAEQQRMLLEKLYEFSRRILLLDRRQAPGPQVIFLVREIFQFECAVMFDAATARLDATEASSQEMEERARAVFLKNAIQPDADGKMWQRVLRLGSRSIGSMVMRGGAVNAATIDAIASLMAIALERARSFDSESRAEAARQSEELRAAVLDGLAHAFKTPLTAIRTASSGLLETGKLNANDADMVALIDQESERLNKLTTRLLQTARMDDAHVRLQRSRVSIEDLSEEVLASYREQLMGHRVAVSIRPPDLTVFVDREMLATGIGQLLDNAAKYSSPGSPIELSAEDGQGEVTISVHNEGSTIRPPDRERIFDRFYRADDSKHRAPGTGLGLSIVKRTAEAHGGRVWVISEANEGTTFFLTLPQDQRKA